MAQKRYRRGQFPSIPSGRAVVLAVVLALLAVGAALWFAMPTDCGTDTACFVRHAAACRASRVTIADDRGEATLTERSCAIEKKLTSLPDAVPSMQALLVGKTMTCVHPEGFVPATVIASPTSGTESCSGPLKETLVELSSAG